MPVQELKNKQETKDLQDLHSDLEEMQNNNKPSQDKSRQSFMARKYRTRKKHQYLGGDWICSQEEYNYIKDQFISTGVKDEEIWVNDIRH